MPKHYSYALSNGKTLDLEGDTQPTDEEVESIAKEQGVSLVAADAKTPPPEQPTQPKKEGWASRYPKTATAIRLGLDTLPGLGAIGGGVLATPETMGLGSVAGAALGAGAGRGLRDLVAEGIGVDQPTGPLSKAMRIGADTAMTAVTPGAMEAVTHPVDAMKMAGEDLGHLVPRSVRNAFRSLKPPTTEGPTLKLPQWQMNQRIAASEVPHTTVDAVHVDPSAPPEGVQEGEILGESFTRKSLPAGASRVIQVPPSSARSLSNDPSFVRSVPAESGPQPQRPALPPHREPIITAPPEDTSGITVTSAKKTDLPVRDPKTGRMKRVFTSESAGDTPKTPVSTPEKPALQSKVQELSGKGHGAEEIADQLKDDPALKGKSKTERINLVREARGGPSGEMPGRAKQAIDQALAKMKTTDEKRAYLMRAPNAAAYDYIKGRIGL